MDFIEVRQRLMIPTTVTSFRDNFVEMRRIGPYPQALPFTIVFSYFELVHSGGFPAKEARLPLLFPSAKGDPELSYPLQDKANAEEVEAMLHSESFLHKFKALVCDFLQANSIPEETDTKFSNIEAMARSLCIGIDIDFGPGIIQPVIEHAKTRLSIGVLNKSVFVLYDHYTTCSFLKLPCGHLQFKYHLLRELQTLAANTTVSFSPELFPPDLNNILLCEQCDLYLDKEKHGYILDIVQGLANSDYSIPAKEVYEVEFLQKFVCSLCKDVIPDEKIVVLCSCPNTICMQCFIVNRFTANYEKCPKCKKRLEDTYRIDEAILDQDLIKPRKLRHQTCASSTIEKDCFMCQIPKKFQDFTVLQDHLNCWCCISCVRIQLKSEDNFCDHCYRKYDLSSPVIAELLADLERERAAIPEHQDSACLQADKVYVPEDEADVGDDNQTEIVTVPILNTRCKFQVTGNLQMNLLCKLCNAEIEEVLIKAIPSHRDCLVCYNCLTRKSNLKLCLGCTREFTEEERTAIKQIGDQIAKGEEYKTESVVRCTLCQKLVSEPYHLCQRGKVQCAECYKERMIESYTQQNSTCGLCRQDLDSTLGTALLSTRVDCACCKNRLQFPEIAHWCQREQFYCVTCMGITNERRFTCPNCKTQLNNKFIRK